MSKVCFFCCIPGSHTVIRQSSPPAARYCPSGLQDTLLTDAASPVNCAVCERRLMRFSSLVKLLSNVRGPVLATDRGDRPGRRQPSSLQQRRSLAPMSLLYYALGGPSIHAVERLS